MTDNYKSLYNCIEAYTTSFCKVEEEDGFIRFSDEAIHDMYDHNYILMQPETDVDDCQQIILEEIERRKAQGETFCQAYLSSARQIEGVAQMEFPIKPDVTNYVNCITTTPKDLKLVGRGDCMVRRVENPAMAEDRTAIEVESYDSDFGADFCRRKGKINAKVYMAEEGVDSYVCYVDGKPVGKADLMVHDGWAMIEDFDVVPSMQRKGIGTTILRVLVDEAMARGADNIVLVAYADDTAKDMYQKLGCTVIPGRTSLFFEWK